MKTAQRPRADRHQLSVTLADRRSRHLLSCLQSGPATERDLAVALAAATRDCAHSAVTADDRRRFRQRLDHRYLPRLTDAGLVVESTDGLVRYDPEVLEPFDVKMPSLADPDHPAWPAAAAVLGRASRYPLVSAVAEQQSVSLSRLADRLADTDEASRTSRELAIALYHVDLPKLAGVDLLTYDPEARTVSSTPETETVL